MTDNIGIYYDPSRPSRLGKFIEIRLDQITRADALIKSLTSQGISKYNLSGAEVQLPKGERVLVVGQVEDDASIRLGAGVISTNRALLENARSAHPDARLSYKPHPDVTAGLLAGAFNAAELADLMLPNPDISALLSEVSKL